MEEENIVDDNSESNKKQFKGKFIESSLDSLGLGAQFSIPKFDYPKAFAFESIAKIKAIIDTPAIIALQRNLIDNFQPNHFLFPRYASDIERYKINSITEMARSIGRPSVDLMTLPAVLKYFELSKQHSSLFNNLNYAPFLYKNEAFVALHTNNPLKNIAACLSAIINGRALFNANSLIDLKSLNVLSKINYSNIGIRIDNSTLTKATLANSFVDLSKYYSGFNSLENRRSLGDELITAASNDYLYKAKILHAYSIPNTVTEGEHSEGTTFVLEIENKIGTQLNLLHSKLYDKWQGAIEVLDNRGKDYLSMFSNSTRELLRFTFDFLAPDNLVLEWMKNTATTSSDMYHTGNSNMPSRTAKLKYVCRNCSDRMLPEYMKKQISTLTSFFSVLNKGTHSLDDPFTFDEAMLLRIGLETNLNFLLLVHFQFNS